MPDNDTLSPAVLDQLRKYDTPTICNVIELFDCRPRNVGYMDKRIQACFPKMPPMVGFASTATFRSSAAPSSGSVYGSMTDQLKAFESLPGPAVVVFQDLDDPSTAATFGEVMCTTYQTFAAVGLITSGTGRDLDQVEALNFPCFTNGTCCAHGYCHIVDVHEPVHVGGVMIQPGELLHGDRNGVTTIPIDIAEAVANACEPYMAAEAIVLDYLKSEKPTPEGFADARKGCQARLEELAKQVRAS